MHQYKTSRSLHFYKVFLMSFALLLGSSMSVKASPASDVQKMLKYYKKGKYSQAEKIAQKYAKKKADEKKYRKKLPSRAVKAYTKVLKTYSLIHDGEYLWEYFVKDLDGKGLPELCVYYGACEANVRLQVYRFVNGKAKYITEKPCSHGSFYDIPGKKGVIYCYGHKSLEEIKVVTLKKNKLIFKRMGGRKLLHSDGTIDDWLSIPFQFPKHKVWKKGYSGVKYLSLSGIKKGGKIYPKNNN